MVRNDKHDLLRRLRDLEHAADNANVGESAAYLNQAGDLCLQASQPSRALEYYGLAIDSHVKADRFAPAMALCKKVMRVQPEVVRARCTLTWLTIGSGFEGDACMLVDKYVDAAERAGRESYAVSQLRWMADIAAQEELRVAVGDALLHLGDYKSADHVFGRAFSARNGVSRASGPADEERWSMARRAALLTPRDFAA
jgi:hypothetical protein